MNKLRHSLHSATRRVGGRSTPSPPARRWRERSGRNYAPSAGRGLVATHPPYGPHRCPHSFDRLHRWSSSQLVSARAHSTVLLQRPHPQRAAYMLLWRGCNLREGVALGDRSWGCRGVGLRSRPYSDTSGLLARVLVLHIRNRARDQAQEASEEPHAGGRVLRISMRITRRPTTCTADVLDVNVECEWDAHLRSDSWSRTAVFGDHRFRPHAPRALSFRW